MEQIGETEYESLKKTLKFGDIIENGWASEDNPRRFGIVVNPRAFSIQCTDKIIFWDLLFSPDSKIKVHGNVLNDNYEKIKQNGV
jgi:hypothetical protein